MMNWSRDRHPALAALTLQRGAATLLTALILLTVITLASFVAHRSLIADQAMAGNHYRALRARMAAEVGLELAVSHLQNSEGRDALLEYIEDGYRIPPGTLYRPTEDAFGPVATTAGWSSSLVTLDDATPEGDTLPTAALTARGCWTSTSEADAACSVCSADCANTAIAASMVKFVSALPSPPTAALTSRATIDLTGASLVIANTSTQCGYTVHAGGAVSIGGAIELIGIPGTPVAASLISGDDSLRAGSTEDYFQRFFGLPRTVHRDMADVRISCEAECSESLQDVTDRIIWLEGGGMPMRLDSARLGSEARPVILIADGSLELRGDTRITGLVFAHTLDWDAAGASAAHMTGALIVSDGLAASGAPRIDYDPTILRTLALRLGSVVRVPGSWRDF